MKKSSLMLLSAFTALFAVSCDKIDDTLKPYVPTGGDKTVLIKDFTGVRCVNCPEAAATVHELQHRYGEDKVFVMSVHAGPMATSVGIFPDFTTEEGNEWYGDNDSNPLLNVDHVDLASESLNVSQIDQPLGEALNEEQVFDVKVTNDYDENSRKLTTKTDITAIDNVDGNFYLTACLIEDSIVGPQITPPPSGLDTSYVHRNVFRKTLNGAYGVMVQEGYVYLDAQYDFQYEIELAPEYNADQCYVMSYVYDRNTKKIYQTAMTKVK